MSSSALRGRYGFAHLHLPSLTFSYIPFLRLAEQLIDDYGISMSMVEQATENFCKTRDVMFARHNVRWRALAARVDNMCTVIFPTAFVTLLVALFNISLEDGYAADENGVVPNRVMFIGIPPKISLEDGGLGRLMLLPILVLTLMPALYVARQQILVSLTKDKDDNVYDGRIKFVLKPSWAWSFPLVPKWLRATAHRDCTDDSKPDVPLYGHKYTQQDLDNVIARKIAPDMRTKFVTQHVIERGPAAAEKPRRRPSVFHSAVQFFAPTSTATSS